MEVYIANSIYPTYEEELIERRIHQDAISVTGVVVVRIAVVVDIGEIGSGVQRLPDD